jgi:hypothetical protein
MYENLKSQAFAIEDAQYSDSTVHFEKPKPNTKYFFLVYPGPGRGVRQRSEK